MELSKLSDIALVRKIKNENSSEAFIELRKRHEKLYYSTAASYCRKIKQLDYENLVQDLDIVLLKTVKTFNQKKKSKVSSYFCNMSRYHVLNTIKRLNELGVFSYEDNNTLDILNNSFNNIHIDSHSKEELKDHIFSILDTIKDSRVKKIFELRYYSDQKSQKWKNISKEMKLSTQQCLNLLSVGQKLIYKQMIKENNK